jgi:peptidoglycan/xylan/chitin deacetylase (PgdA/CDA1 family)
MGALFHRAWRYAFEEMPLALAQRLAASGVVAPCYHLVSDRPPIHVKYLYECRAVAEFEAELDLLLRYFKPLSLEDLARAIREHGRPPDGSLFLSFDDGFREVTEQIAPICLAKGVPATFFLNTGFLDNQALFFRHKASILAHRCSVLGRKRSSDALRRLEAWAGVQAPEEVFLSLTYQQTEMLNQCGEVLGVDFGSYLRAEKPYLTGEQVEDVRRKGFDVGGHSVDHPLYADLSLDERLTQTRRCMTEIGRRFPAKVKGFAFPFGSDGGSPELHRTILAEGTADLIFYCGSEPGVESERLVQRFGVEQRHAQPLTQLLRGEAGRTCRSRVGRWRRNVTTF